MVVQTEMDDALNGRAFCRQTLTGPRLCLVSIGQVHASNNTLLEIRDGHVYMLCYSVLCSGELYLGEIQTCPPDILNQGEALDLVCHSVWKEFHYGWFQGTILVYHESKSLFEVLYTNGGQEDMTFAELLRHTKPPDPALQLVIRARRHGPQYALI